MTRKIIPIFFIILLVAASALVWFLYFQRSSGGIFLGAAPVQPPDEASLKTFLRVGFDDPSELEHWKIHNFNGQSKFEMTKDDSGSNVLEVQSEGNCSLLLHEANVDVSNHPHLSWEWRVLKFPSGKTNKEFASENDSDFGARVFVVFNGLTPFTSATIQYVWDDHFAVGTYRSSPAARHIKLMVVRSGSAGADQWVKEVRDIFKDYELLFGRPPKNAVHAVGIMSDSDNTKTSSHAEFRNISIQVPKSTAGNISESRLRIGIVYSVFESFLSLKKMSDAARERTRPGLNGFFSFLTKLRDETVGRFQVPRHD